MSIAKKSFSFALQALIALFILSIILLILPSSMTQGTGALVFYLVVYSPILYFVLFFYFLFLQTVIEILDWQKKEVIFKFIASSLLVLTIRLLVLLYDNYFGFPSDVESFGYSSVVGALLLGFFIAIPFAIEEYKK